MFTFSSLSLEKLEGSVTFDELYNLIYDDDKNNGKMILCGFEIPYWKDNSQYRWFYVPNPYL
jgi:hypothetical protein